jgi:hypothetical protein
MRVFLFATLGHLIRWLALFCKFQSSWFWLKYWKFEDQILLPLSLQLVRIWIIGTLAANTRNPVICSDSLGTTSLTCTWEISANKLNPGEVAPTHYLYEVGWGISWPHGKETISFYIWVTFHMYLCLYIYIRNTRACYLNLYPNYPRVII